MNRHTRVMRSQVAWSCLVAIAALVLGGCVTTSSRPRYDYDLSVKNDCDRPVSVEILYVDSPGVGRVGADLAPGGRYSTLFSTERSLDYAEARLRLLDPSADAAGPFFIYKMSRERALYVITREGERLLWAVRPLPDGRGS